MRTQKLNSRSIRNAFYIWFTCLIALVIFSGVEAKDWSTYRHDNTRSGITGEHLSPPLSLHWVFTPNHAPKPAWMKPAEELPRMHSDRAHHVTIADGKVYFGSSVDNKIYAIDVKTGKVLWAFFTEGPVRFAPAIWKNRIYFGSDDGYVYCLRAGDGIPVWKYRAGPSDERIIGNGRMISLWPVRTSVLVEDGVVYFGAGVFPYEGIYICALKSDDGTVIWRNDTIGDHAHELEYGGISPQSYLVASEDILYVPSGRAMPAAFDRESGEFLYYCSPGGHVGGTWALVMEGELIAGVEASGTPAKVAYDERTGTRKGDAYAWFPGLDMVITPEVAYTLSEEGIHAIDRTAYPDISKILSSLREERKNLGAILTDVRGKLSQVAEDARTDLDSQVDKITDRINSLSLEEEKLLKTMACKWQYYRKGLSSLILAGDAIFAGGDGIVLALDARTGKELWNYQINGVSLGIAVSDGKLFVSTDKGPVYCFGKEKSDVFENRPDIEPSPYPKDELTSVYEAAADTILRETGIKKGYCLILDCDIGRLAYEIAKRTELKVVGIEDDPKKVEMAKNKLDKAGLYGSRVVVEQWRLSSLPDCFANLIVSDGMMTLRKTGMPEEEIFRVLRPCGGVAYIPDAGYQIQIAGYECRESSIQHLLMAVRGKLEGAGSWTQLYGNPQNTACSDDQLVKAPLSVLWFGEPGPEKMVERHGRATSPVSIDGRLFIQGAEVIMAYDAYNGTFLWEKNIPGAVRVRADVDGGNLAATEDGLYIAAYDKCYRLNPATGEIIRTYDVPASSDDSPRRWGYVSCTGNILFGSAAMPLKMDYAAFWKNFVKDDGTWKSADAVPPEYKNQYKIYTSNYPVPDEDALAAFHRGGVLWRPMSDQPAWGSQRSPKGALTEAMMTGDAVFAMDTETGKLLWIHHGKRIANIAVAVGDGQIFFAEASVAEQQKKEAFEERQRLVENGIYEKSVEAELGPEDADVRFIFALDTSTGEKLWEKPLDLTGCGGDKMGLAYHDDAALLLFFGHYSNHDGGLFREGSLMWRRITALSVSTREVAWSRPLNYLRRPLIVGDNIIIEPRACDVRTGQIKTRSHPITGEQTTWEFLRPGHSCGITSAAPNCIFYRSYCTAIYDLAEDRGLTLFGGIRPGCWINLISANGLLLFPEASSGCTCSFPIRCSVAMKSKTSRKTRDWTVFITSGDMTPVRHFAANFGAPGDMRDDKNTIWFGYPRPKVEYGVKFNLSEEIIQGMGYFCQDFKDARVEGSEAPWLFTSGCLGFVQCKIPLINNTQGEEPGVYTVRIGFMALSGDEPDERVFDIKLQDDVVIKDFDILKESGSPDKAVIKEFKGIKVVDNLVVKFVPKLLNPLITQAPLINFIEVIRGNPED